MKTKTICAALIALFLFAASAEELSARKLIQKQRVTSYTQAVTADPVGLIFGLFNATYEQRLSPENSFTASLLYYSNNGWTGLGLGGSYRWYIVKGSRPIIEGLSFGPAINLYTFEPENEFFDSGMSITVGGEAAYKFVISDGFVIEPSVYLGFPLIKVDDDLSYNVFSFGVRLGYAWR